MIYALLVLLLGILLWALPPLPPKVQEAGRLCFFVGLFFAVWLLSQRGGVTLRL